MILGSKLHVATSVFVCKDRVGTGREERATIVNVPIRVVQDVEDFAAKLEIHPLSHANSILIKARRHIPEARTIKLVPFAHFDWAGPEVVIPRWGPAASPGSD